MTFSATLSSTDQTQTRIQITIMSAANWFKASDPPHRQAATTWAGYVASIARQDVPYTRAVAEEFTKKEGVFAADYLAKYVAYCADLRKQYAGDPTKLMAQKDYAGWQEFGARYAAVYVAGVEPIHQLPHFGTSLAPIVSLTEMDSFRYFHRIKDTDNFEPVSAAEVSRAVLLAEKASLQRRLDWVNEQLVISDFVCGPGTELIPACQPFA